MQCSTMSMFWTRNLVLHLYCCPFEFLHQIFSPTMSKENVKEHSLTSRHYLVLELEKVLDKCLLCIRSREGNTLAPGPTLLPCRRAQSGWNYPCLFVSLFHCLFHYFTVSLFVSLLTGTVCLELPSFVCFKVKLTFTRSASGCQSILSLLIRL